MLFRSQPVFFNSQLAQEGPRNEWDPIAPLSLVLSEDPYAKGHYGSFVNIRKLKQDVAKFNNQIVNGAAAAGIPPALFGAYAVGRFKDGTPVVQSAVAVAPGQVRIPLQTNDFDYRNDIGGLRCPFHAHIRKVCMPPLFTLSRYLTVLYIGKSTWPSRQYGSLWLAGPTDAKDASYRA